MGKWIRDIEGDYLKYSVESGQNWVSFNCLARLSTYFLPELGCMGLAVEQISLELLLLEVWVAVIENSYRTRNRKMTCRSFLTRLKLKNGLTFCLNAPSLNQFT